MRIRVRTIRLECRRVGRHLCAAIAAIAFGAAGAVAAPDEIQVYTEEINDPGEFGLELHTNYALQGATEPSYAGEMKSHHRLQVTPEFSYGLTGALEAGLYLPMARSAEGDLYGNGMRFRLKYIPRRDEGARFFWGLNGELGYSARRVSESRAGFELRPILGYRDADWLLSFNPILGAELSANVSRIPAFEPALKVARRAGERMHAGFEYYGEYGPVHHRIPAAERGHTLYAVGDIAVKGYDINFGIGRGYRNAGDKWVLKAIFSFPFK